MKAVILIRTRATRHSDVADRIGRLKGVMYAFPVMGRTDVVASVQVAGVRELSELALRISRTGDVLMTETMVGLER